MTWILVFLNVVWQREMSLHAKYRRLYSISNQQEALGEIVEGGEWRFSWRRFSHWEEQQLNVLRDDLEGFVWSQEKDVWRRTKFFSVKSSYVKLENLMLLDEKW